VRLAILRERDLVVRGEVGRWHRRRTRTAAPIVQLDPANTSSAACLRDRAVRTIDAHHEQSAAALATKSATIGAAASAAELAFEVGRRPAHRT